MNLRIEKVNELKLFLNDIDSHLKNLFESINWSYENLKKEVPSEMVSCSYNQHHRIPKSRVDIHEEKCRWHNEGYNDYDMPLPNHNGQGSFVTLNSALLGEITSEASTSLTGNCTTRTVPHTAVRYDQTFTREEKLAIYQYVVAHTKKKNLFSDLYTQLPEKKEEKKELSAWEIAAAERDAKRRRASYRNKVHTNQKTYTEVMKEVIDAQMELIKEETLKEVTASGSGLKHKEADKEHKSDSKFQEMKETNKTHSSHDSKRKRSNEDRRHKSKHHYHTCNRSDVQYGEVSNYTWRSSPNPGSRHYNAGSRSDDKYKKWKGREERPRSMKPTRDYRKNRMT